MLMPKRVKFRKTHRGTMKGVATRGNKVSFGDFGLMATEYGWLSAREIEAGRVAATHMMGTEGRLGGAEIARCEHIHLGRIPLNTLRGMIDFAISTAITTKGTIGIKVWIYKGEKFDASPSAGAAPGARAPVLPPAQPAPEKA